MTGVAGPHLDTLFVAIERQRISADFRRPEVLFEFLLQLGRFLPELVRETILSEHRGHTRGRDLSGIDVALYFRQGERPLREAAVAVEDGIVTIFPALVRQSLIGFARVLYKTVTVGIAGSFDPIEGF